MKTLEDALTPAETAVIAGVSVRDVHRIIDEHILPERLYDRSEARSFNSRACVFIAFYFGAADRLTKYSSGFPYNLANCRNSITSIRRSPVSHFDKKECGIPMRSQTFRWLSPASSRALISRWSIRSYVS